MSKTIRSRMVKELGKRFKGVKAAVLVEYQGLSARQADSLRKELKTGQVEMDVLKNSLARLAFKEAGLGLLEKHLSGMTALVHGPDPVAVAKKVLTWKEKNKKLEVRAGILDAALITPDQVKALSALPSREALLAQIAGTFQAPATKFACALNALLQQTAGLLKALEDKKKKEGGAA